ncbi:MAG TPA: hypothetical protein VEO96_00575 [Thermoplasmata archaeon]|nr:hypothetical protein [Thermoplasmata archaeon]
MLEGRRQRFVDLWDRIVADEISPKTRKILALAAVLVFAGDALLTAWSFVYYPTQTTDTSVFYRLLHPTIGAWWIPINFAVGLAMILALYRRFAFGLAIFLAVDCTGLVDGIWIVGRRILGG